MAYVDVELDDFDTSDLIDELEKRISRKKIKNSEMLELKELSSDFVGKFNFPEIKTLDDEFKFEILCEMYLKYNLSELRSLNGRG